ncbi:MAG: calcium:proton antiporter [Desulfobacteraceae bacterium]|nr:calcium:proton antiporter [Desulfobacteraceae bacterium]
MKKSAVIVISMILSLSFTGICFSQDVVSPDEIVAKVKAAAAFLSKAGESGLKEFNDPKGKWAWKDTYVQVYNCEADIIAAHPNNKIIGLQLSTVTDVKGNYVSLDLCDAAEQKAGGWVEYWWPKVGSKTPERKITFTMQAPGVPYQVSAGIYSSIHSLDELNKKK